MFFEVWMRPQSLRSQVASNTLAALKTLLFRRDRCRRRIPGGEISQFRSARTFTDRLFPRTSRSVLDDPTARLAVAVRHSHRHPGMRTRSHHLHPIHSRMSNRTQAVLGGDTHRPTSVLTAGNRPCPPSLATPQPPTPLRRVGCLRRTSVSESLYPHTHCNRRRSNNPVPDPRRLRPSPIAEAMVQRRLETGPGVQLLVAG